MIPVESSNIESIGYDKTQFVLRVKFLTGTTYDYSPVPETIFEGFKDALSKGKYLYKHIIGKYAFTKI